MANMREFINQFQVQPDMKHIILDTDIGGDPDDAFTLLLALGSPELSLDLLVTNDEHKYGRAKYAKKLLSMMGRDVPVVAGTDLGNTMCYFVGGVANESVDTDYISAIRGVVEKNELTYFVCIGPQTNLAEFIAKCPDLSDRVEILIMGGAIDYRRPGVAEHNIRYDVEAARKVFSSDWKKRYVISDVTFNESIKVNETSDVFKSIEDSDVPYKDVLLAPMRAFFSNMYSESLMHDPLTLSTLIGDYVKFKTEKLSMAENGVMSLDPNGKDTVVAASADYAGFWKMFEGRVTGGLIC